MINMHSQVVISRASLQQPHAAFEELAPATIICAEVSAIQGLQKSECCNCRKCRPESMYRACRYILVTSRSFHAPVMRPLVGQLCPRMLLCTEQLLELPGEGRCFRGTLDRNDYRNSHPPKLIGASCLDARSTPARHPKTAYPARHDLDGSSKHSLLTASTLSCPRPARI